MDSLSLITGYLNLYLLFPSFYSLQCKQTTMNTNTHKKDSFCRYVVMHRSTFWRFKRMGQVNIYLRLGRKGKLLTLTLRKPQKLVRMVHFMYYSCCKVYTFITHICFFFNQRWHSHKCLVHVSLRLLYLNLGLFKGQINRRCLLVPLLVL